MIENEREVNNNPGHPMGAHSKRQTAERKDPMIHLSKLVAPFGFAIITMLAFAGEAQACPECDMLPTPAQRAACECPKPVSKPPGDETPSGDKPPGKKPGRTGKQHSGCQDGTENCKCFSNDTCNTGLDCVQKGDEKVCLSACVEPQVRNESGDCAEPACEPTPRNICDRDVAQKDMEDRLYRMELAISGDPTNAEDKGLIGKVDANKVAIDGVSVAVGNAGDRYWWMHFVNAGLILLLGILMLVRTRRKEDDEPQPPTDGKDKPEGQPDLPTPPSAEGPGAPAPQQPPQARAQALPPGMPSMPAHTGPVAPSAQPAPTPQAAPSAVPSPAPPPSQPPAANGDAPGKRTMVGLPTGPAVE